MVPLASFLLRILFNIFIMAIKQVTQIRNMQILKEEILEYPFSENIILFLKNDNNFTRNILYIR